MLSAAWSVPPLPSETCTVNTFAPTSPAPGVPESAPLPATLNLPKANYDQHLVVDTSRIRQELGYQEPVPRDEALRRTIAWERETRPNDIDKLLDYEAEDAALAELQAKGSASDSEPEPHSALLP